MQSRRGLLQRLSAPYPLSFFCPSSCWVFFPTRYLLKLMRRLSGAWRAKYFSFLFIFLLVSPLLRQTKDTTTSTAAATSTVTATATAATSVLHDII